MKDTNSKLNIPDELNPDFIFSCTSTDLLVSAVNGDIDILLLIKKELDNRGLNKNGEWKGFNK